MVVWILDASEGLAGLTFARSLRHILRHDPDVVVIGEIRDQETAKIAVEASLTGHLVLSTLHTNDAPTAVTRLVEIGIEPYLVSCSLLAVLAQRLVRRKSPHCATVEPVDPPMAALLGAGSDEIFLRGAGCHHCHDTGYLGRHAVYELMVATPKLRARIAEGASALELADLAQKDGMIPLTANALELARKGITSLAEVVRVRRGYRGSWDTWNDTHYGRMVQAAYPGWMALGPVHEEDPERMAQVFLAWCVERSLHGSHPGRGI